VNEPRRSFPGTENNESSVAHDHERDAGEAAPRHSRGLAGLKRETRVGLAAMASFAILVTVLVLNHARKKPVADKETSGKSVAQADGAGKRSDASGPKTQPATKSKQPAQRKNTGPTQSGLAGRNGTTGSRLAMQIGGTKKKNENEAEPDAATPAPSPVAGLGGNGSGSQGKGGSGEIDDVAAPKPVTTATQSNENVAAGDAIAAPAPVDRGGQEKASQGDEARPNVVAEIGGQNETPPRAPVSPGPSQPAATPSPTESSAALLSPATSGSVGSDDDGALQRRNAAGGGNVPSQAGNEEKPELLPAESENASSQLSTKKRQTRETTEQPVSAAPHDPATGAGLPNLSATPSPSEPTRVVTPEEPSRSLAQPDASGLVALPNSKKPLAPARPVEEQEAPAVIAPGPAAPAENNDGQVEPVVHVVQRGENFWTISRLYYGNGRFYKALWKANEDQVRAPEDLYVGTSIRVPPPEALDRSLIEAPRRKDVSSAPSPTTAVRPRTNARRNTDSTATPGNIVILPVRTPRSSASSRSEEELPDTRTARRYYVVKKHETLRSIARDQLGDSHRYEELRDLNLRVLGDSVVLTAGMKLELPDEDETVKK
jgi:nucleoid-associated protein YgaU